MNLGLPSWLTGLAMLFLSQASQCDGCEPCEPGSVELCSQDEGVCKGGVHICAPDGTWGACDPCLSLGVCGGTMAECRAGRWYCPYPPEYQAGGETSCNDGLDNDCNGVIDDALLPPPIDLCPDRGVCQRAYAICRSGQWQCKVPLEHQVAESFCDGLDNDCDGQTDEGLAGELGELCPAIPDSPCGEGPLECTCRAGHQCTYPNDPDLLATICSTWPGGSRFQGVAREECPADDDRLDSDCNGRINDDTHCRPDCDPVVTLTSEADLADCRGFTFTRPSAAYVLSFNPESDQPRLELKDPDEIRWEYVPELVGPVEIRKKALLIEGTSTNLLRFSTNPYRDGALRPPWLLQGPNISASNVANDPNSPSLDRKITRLTAVRNKGYQALWQAVDDTDPVDVGPVYHLYSSSFWLKRVTLTDCRLFYQDVNPYLTVLTVPDRWTRIVAPYPASQVDQLVDNRNMLFGLECNAGAGTDKSADVYGFQLEELPFASSFVPNEGDRNFRAADQLELPPDLIRAARGTYLVWLRPQYLPTEVELAGYPVLTAGQYLKFMVQRDDEHGHGKPTCFSGTREATIEIAADEWSRNDWIFLACVWDVDTIRAYYFDGELKQAVSQGGELSDQPIDSLRPAPMWAHSRDIRIYRSARTEAELREFIDQTRATYGR